MRKLLFTFLLILITENSYGSECTQKVAGQSGGTTENPQTNSNSQEPTSQSVISSESTSSPANPSKNPTESADTSTIRSSESSSTSSLDNSSTDSSDSSSSDPSDSSSSSTSTSPTSSPNAGSLRRLLDNEDCKSLKTADDNKYQCVVSSDGKRCEEVAKENSSRLFLSFIFAIIFIIV